MPETITDRKLLAEVVWGFEEEYKIIQQRLVKQTRWTVLIETVFMRESDSKLFLVTWCKAATENQDHDYPNEAVECEAYAETVTKYRKVV